MIDNNNLIFMCQLGDGHSCINATCKTKSVESNIFIHVFIIAECYN